MITWERRDAWIGVFDILGFKTIIREADREFPRALLTSKLSDLLECLRSETRIGGQLEYLIFSDTFVVIAPDLELRSYSDFLSACESLIVKSIYLELPLRGAVSVGPLYLCRKPMIILGSAFVEAHEYCDDQNWIGLLLTPSATTALRAGGLEPLNHDFVSDQIPLREKLSENVLAYRFQNGRANFKSPLITHLEQMRHFAPEYAKSKYEKTIAFIRHNYKMIER